MRVACFFLEISTHKTVAFWKFWHNWVQCFNLRRLDTLEWKFARMNKMFKSKLMCIKILRNNTTHLAIGSPPTCLRNLLNQILRPLKYRLWWVSFISQGLFRSRQLRFFTLFLLFASNNPNKQTIQNNGHHGYQIAWF